MIGNYLEAIAGMLERTGLDAEAREMYERALRASEHVHARLTNHRVSAALLERIGDLRGALEYQ